MRLPPSLRPYLAGVTAISPLRDCYRSFMCPAVRPARRKRPTATLAWSITATSAPRLTEVRGVVRRPSDAFDGLQGGFIDPVAVRCCVHG